MDSILLLPSVKRFFGTCSDGFRAYGIQAPPFPSQFSPQQPLRGVVLWSFVPLSFLFPPLLDHLAEEDFSQPPPFRLHPPPLFF